MKDLSTYALSRLRKIMLEDKLQLDSIGFEMLRSDLSRVLKSYFEYKDKDLEITADIRVDGQVDVSIKLVADSILPCKAIK